MTEDQVRDEARSLLSLDKINKKEATCGVGLMNSPKMSKVQISEVPEAGVEKESKQWKICFCVHCLISGQTFRSTYLNF